MPKNTAYLMVIDAGKKKLNSLKKYAAMDFFHGDNYTCDTSITCKLTALFERFFDSSSLKGPTHTRLCYNNLWPSTPQFRQQTIVVLAGEPLCS